MNHELDHFFILTQPGAPEADLLRAVGLQEGEPNRHLGQGTANRRFFFANVMLELLYVCDEEEAALGPGKHFRITERVADGDASPFGLVFRESAAAGSPLFCGLEYHPEYLPDQSFLRIGRNSQLWAEPLCIGLPPDFPKVLGKAPQRRMPSHVTGLCISVPVTRPSETLESVARIQPLSLRLGQPHRMELTFDHGSSGRTTDFSPHLPLLIRW